MVTLEDTIRKYRLRWAGHVRRMDDTQLPKKILFGPVAGGKKSAEKSKKNWVDCLEEDCGPTFPTVCGQKRREIEPLGRIQSRS